MMTNSVRAWLDLLDDSIQYKESVRAHLGATSPWYRHIFCWCTAFETECFGMAIKALKAGFNPSQPRVPAGNSDGGQWADGGGGGSGGRSIQDDVEDDVERPRRERLKPVAVVAENTRGPVMSDASPNSVIRGRDMHIPTKNKRAQACDTACF